MPGRRRAISGHNGVLYPDLRISLKICFSSSKFYSYIIKSRRLPKMTPTFQPSLGLICQVAVGAAHNGDAANAYACPITFK